LGLYFISSISFLASYLSMLSIALNEKFKDEISPCSKYPHLAFALAFKPFHELRSSVIHAFLAISK